MSISQQSASNSVPSFPNNNASLKTNNTSSSANANNPVDEELLEAAYELKIQKRDALIKQIQNLRSQKENYKKRSDTLSKVKTLWMHRYNQAVMQRTLAISDYAREQKHFEELEADYEKLIKVNVLQDVFHIWHRGHGTYATINGLRIGMSMSVNGSSGPTSSESGDNSDCRTIDSTSSSLSTPNSSGNSSLLNSFWNNTSVPINNTANSNANRTSTTSTSTFTSTSNNTVQVQVPWHEINAAVGMIALLIHTLQAKLKIHQYQRYKYMIQPRGSTTKVLSRKTKQEWDLFHQPAAFQFFAKRNWNAALTILGYCLFELVSEVERLRVQMGLGLASENLDTTNAKEVQTCKEDSRCWSMPFPVSLEGDWANERIGVVKIAGLDISFNGDGVEWTKAMRYLAIDLKLIVAFVSKYISE